MGLIALIIAFILIGALILQSASCLLTRGRPQSIGILDLCLAGIASLVLLSLVSGQMVIGTEFGAVMAQGDWTIWMLRLSLVVAAVLPGLCWCRIRQLNQWRPLFLLAVLIGLSVGVWAATRVVPFNPITPNDPKSLQVFRYDVWWPPLIVWFVICLAGSILALVEVASSFLCSMLASTMVSLLASFALHFEDLPDPDSGPDWRFLERVGLPLALLLLLFRIFEPKLRGDRRRLLWIVTTGIFAALSIALAFLDVPLAARAALNALPLLFVAGGFTAAIIQAMAVWAPRDSATGQQRISPTLRWVSESSVTRNLRRTFPIRRVGGIASALELLLTFVGLVDFFSIGLVSRPIEVLVLFTLWLFFTERLAEGALHSLPAAVKKGRVQFAAMVPVGRLIGAANRVARNSSAAVFRLFTEGEGWVVAAKSIAGIILLLFILTALNEALNYQTMVISSFNWIDAGDAQEAQAGKGTKDAKQAAEAKNNISRLVSDGLINELGRLRHDLRTDLILVHRNSSGERPKDVHFAQVGMGSSQPEAVVAKGEDVEIAGMKIPLPSLLAPVQNAIRSLMSVHVISGSIRKDAQDEYTVWANSNSGETWRET